MGLSIITPPTDPAVTLAEAKAQCRVDSSDEDTLIERLASAATAFVEKYCGIALMTRTYKLTLDEFSDSMELPYGPVSSVTAVRYFDTDGNEQTVSTDVYTADLTSRPQWVVRNQNESWPETLDAVNAVSIEYVAGQDTLPAEYDDVRHAILLLIGQWYDHRTGVSDTTITEVPHAVAALLSNHRSFS